jgi:probable rRNA maturation factor
MTKIFVNNSQKNLKISKNQVRKVFEILIEFKNISVDELEVNFITDAAMKKQHQILFQDPSSTDCITCPIDDPYEKDLDYCVLGSCFICPKTAIEHVKKKQLDPYREVTLYCVHCFLHLIGYDDIDPKARAQMRRQEKVCLKALDEKNAILTGTPR